MAKKNIKALKTKKTKTVKTAPKKTTSRPVAKTAKKPVRGKTVKSGAKSAVKSQKSTRPAKKNVKTKKSARVARYAGIYEALQRLRENINNQIDFLATDNLNRKPNDTEVDFRSEEQGTDNYDRDFALTRVSSDQDIVFEIDEALNRLEMGTYGQCEGCECEIEKARLMALPYSRLCVACQSLIESDRRRVRPSDASAFLNISEKNLSENTSEDE